MKVVWRSRRDNRAGPSKERQCCALEVNLARTITKTTTTQASQKPAARGWSGEVLGAPACDMAGLCFHREVPRAEKAGVAAPHYMLRLVEPHGRGEAGLRPAMLDLRCEKTARGRERQPPWNIAGLGRKPSPPFLLSIYCGRRPEEGEPSALAFPGGLNSYVGSRLFNESRKVGQSQSRQRRRRRVRGQKAPQSEGPQKEACPPSTAWPMQWGSWSPSAAALPGAARRRTRPGRRRWPRWRPGGPRRRWRSRPARATCPRSPGW